MFLFWYGLLMIFPFFINKTKGQGYTTTANYHYISQLKSWNAASLYCLDTFGTTLARIDSATLQQELLNEFPTGINEIWIGGSDLKNENIWLWEDGTEFYRNGAIPGVFSDFLSGEPNNFNNNEDCLLLITDFEQSQFFWNDGNCVDLRHFACNRDTTCTSAPPTASPTSVPTLPTNKPTPSPTPSPTLVSTGCVYIRSIQFNDYVRAEQDGTLTATTSSGNQGAWEQYKLIPKGTNGNEFVIQCIHDRKYWHVENDGTMACDTYNQGAWETFEVQSCGNNNCYYLKTAHNTWVDVKNQQGNLLKADNTSPGAYQRIEIKASICHWT